MIEAVEPESLDEVVTTWKEVCQRYPDQWVVLVETDWIDAGKSSFRSARVVGHGVRCADAVAQARPVTARYRAYGTFFTGRVRAPLLGFFAS